MGGGGGSVLFPDLMVVPHRNPVPKDLTILKRRRVFTKYTFLVDW